MYQNNISLLILLVIVLLTGCSDKRTEQSNEEPTTPATVDHMILSGISGDYVDDFYSKRSEGYDWVAVSVSPLKKTEAWIQIRSRSDRKEPTCTFEGIGVIKDEATLEVDLQGKKILFLFDGDSLRITTENKSDLDFLMYFCSGGGSIAGTYTKLDEPFDESQITLSGFNRTLSLQDITFDIHASRQGSQNILVIQPTGLEIDNNRVFHQIDGIASDAEIEDLNSDGSPEIVVYITSMGSGSYGTVIAYSVNNKKSMSQIYFPPVTENPEISEGYMGHDEFTLIETFLVQRFPVYKDGDPNSSPTGGIRQIQYELIEGEASRRFKVVKVDTYPVDL